MQTKNIILILQTVNYKVDFHPQRELKMCQNLIGCVHTSRYLIICIHFLSMYIRNKIHTCLYTILAIVVFDKISIIGFLSRKIKSVLKWWGITWKSFGSLFKEAKAYVQCNIRGQKLDPRCEINKHIVQYFYISTIQIYYQCIYFPTNVCIAK
jgi:hypothetical protein